MAQGFSPACSRYSSRIGRLVRCVVVTAALLAIGGRTVCAAGARGRVVDPDGRPVAGATVLVDGPLGTTVLLADDEGRFEIVADASASYRVIAKASGLISDPIMVRLPDTAARDLTITLHLAPIAEAVVVSAAQVPRPLSEAPASSTVIERDEVEARQLETVSDALRTLAGMTVARNGGRGALTSVFPRGGESDYTLVLVDGVRANSFGGGFDFALLPFGDVSQVEVVRGPQSALYGSDAIGGIVQVTTRTGGAPTGSASVEGGSQDTLHSRAGGAGTAGQWSFGGGVEYFRSTGFTGIAPANGEPVTNDDWRSTSAAGSLGWTKSDATGLRGTFRWLDDARGAPGPYGSNPIDAFPGVDTVARGANTVKQVGLAVHMPWGRVLAGRLQQRFQLTWADGDNFYHSAFGDSTLGSRRATFRAQTDLAASPSTGLSFGIEALGERARSTYVVGVQGQGIPIERHTAGAFIELRQDLGSRATITAGVRVDDIARQALQADPNGFTPRPAFPADNVTSVNPRVAGTAILWQDARGAVRTRLHASVGTGIRPPDTFEIAFTDNPSLKPERSRSVDAGISQVVTSRVMVDATWFYNRYEDLIVATGSFSDVSRFMTDNIANAKASGLELSLSTRGPHGLSARASYTFLPTEVLAVDRTTAAPPPFTVGDPLIRRPRQQGSLNLLWTSTSVSVFAEARARGTVLDVEPNYGTFGGLFTAPGFFVVDTGASWHLRPSIEIYGRALNLLDRPYEEIYGYPSLGRSLLGGLRVAVRP
jgi:outer membrane cobalamin receptor